MKEIYAEFSQSKLLVPGFLSETPRQTLRTSARKRN